MIKELQVWQQKHAKGGTDDQKTTGERKSRRTKVQGAVGIFNPFSKVKESAR